ncbi:MAG: MFS transporter [Legionellales bacterium]|nr:MFS transporter [Legionellales bacterium]
MPSSRFIKLLSGIYLFLFYDFFQLDMMNEVSPYLQHLLMLSPIQLGIINSMFFYINFALLIPAGFLLDKYKSRNLIIISLIINALSQSLFIIIPHYASALLWRAGAGFAGAFSYLTALKVLSDNFNSKNLGVLIGFSGFSIMLAGVVAQSPLSFILQRMGLMPILIVNVILSLVVIIVVAWLLSNSNFKKSSSSFIDDLKVFSKLLSLNKNILIALFAGMINMPLFILGASWGIIYLTSHTHISAIQATIATSTLFIGDIIGAPIMGYISDRFLPRSQLMAIGACCNFLTILSINFINSPIALIATFFITGFTCTTQTPAAALIIELNNRQHAARASSIVSAVSIGFIALSDPLIGSIIELTNTHDIIVLILTITSFTALILSFILLKVT